MTTQWLIVGIFMFFVILISIQYTLNRLLFYMKEIVSLLQMLANQSK